MKKTKIVATISDLNCEVDFIRSLFEAGMNVVRLNTAHQSPEETLTIVKNVRAVSNKIALLLDTKGPEIRTTDIKQPIAVEKHQEVRIYNADSKKEGDSAFNVSYNHFIEEMDVGKIILVDDGYLELHVTKKYKDYLVCKASHQGVIKNKKSINVPESAFNLPSLSEKDRLYVQFAIEHDIDFIAHSFVRNKRDLMDIQEIIDANNSNVKIIAKIENQQGVDNIDEILDIAYGIMVARGDLAIEIPFERIPSVQNFLIKKGISRRKPVIIATQMLHSMIKEPRPTRAEVNDIANAVWGKTDALMLSGETAFGDFPLESVHTMAKIAYEIESSRKDFHETDLAVVSTDISAFLSKSAVEASISLDAKAIICDTTWGRTIRNMAGYRGRKEIIAYCYSERTMRELTLSFGVLPEYYADSDSKHDFVKPALKKLLQKEKILPGDRVVVVGGNFGAHHGASYMEISSVKNLT